MSIYEHGIYTDMFVAACFGLIWPRFAWFMLLIGVVMDFFS